MFKGGRGNSHRPKIEIINYKTSIINTSTYVQSYIEFEVHLYTLSIPKYILW